MLVYSDHAIEAHIVLFVLSGADAGRRLSNLPLTGLYTDGTRLYWWQFVQMPRTRSSPRLSSRTDQSTDPYPVGDAGGGGYGAVYAAGPVSSLCKFSPLNSPVELD